MFGLQMSSVSAVVGFSSHSSKLSQFGQEGLPRRSTRSGVWRKNNLASSACSLVGWLDTKPMTNNIPLEVKSTMFKMVVYNKGASTSLRDIITAFHPHRFALTSFRGRGAAMFRADQSHAAGTHGQSHGMATGRGGRGRRKGEPRPSMRGRVTYMRVHKWGLCFDDIPYMDDLGEGRGPLRSVEGGLSQNAISEASWLPSWSIAFPRSNRVQYHALFQSTG